MSEILGGFVVLEGLDGAGTTTQLRLLERRFADEGLLGHCTCEPTSGPVGSVIRAALAGRVHLEPRTMALLFAADRWEHINSPETGVRARLSRGQVVVSDRYLFSSLAYQGVEWSFDSVLDLHRDFPLPAHVIYVDTPVDVSQARLAERAGRDLYDSADLQRRVAAGYERAFAALALTGTLLHRVDGRLPPQRIAEHVWKVVLSLPIIRA
jgi:dTMP kinase